MKKIEAVIKPFKLDEVKEALEREKIRRINVFEVKGAGSQQGKIKIYRGVQYIEDAPEVKVEITVEDDDLERVANAIVTALRTGDLSDGEVVILPIERVIRLRTGARSHSGSNWQRDMTPTCLMRNRTSLRSYLKTLGRKLYETDRGDY